MGTKNFFIIAFLNFYFFKTFFFEVCYASFSLTNLHYSNDLHGILVSF